MKIIIATLFFCLFNRIGFAQESAVPKSYLQLKEIFGDLNKDGIDERVVVYNTTDTIDEINGNDREIIVFKKESGSWKIWHRSIKAIGNSKDGGMMGDPFEGIEIKNGALIISQSGGSSWKWANKDKYRFQNNSFELIGYTGNYGKLCEYWMDVDYNVSTGDIAIKKEHENCDNEKQEIYKRENENFKQKRTKKITLENRQEADIKIVSPKYKHEVFL